MTEKVWDFADKFSEHVHREDRIRRKKLQIANVTSNRCGNCNHWMTSSCKREKEFGEFKSSDSLGCGQFDMCRSSVELAEKFRGELREEENGK